LDPNPDVIDLTVAPLQSKIIKQIKCGSSHCVVLSTDNSIAAWGLNLNGQLGDGTTTTNKAPVAVVAGSIAGAALNRIEAGGSFSLAVTSAGYIHAWGANARNQLGNGGTADSSSPTAVDMTVLDNRSLKKISSGNTFTYVLTQDSKIIGWG
jgi:alpha-tubulin suppressor-like RCC1 family protein